MQPYVIQQLNAIKIVGPSSDKTNFRSRLWKSHTARSAWDCFLQRGSPAWSSRVKTLQASLSRISRRVDGLKKTYLIHVMWYNSHIPCMLDTAELFQRIYPADDGQLAHRTHLDAQTRKMSCYQHHKTDDAARWIDLSQCRCPKSLLWTKSTLFAHVYHEDMFEPKREIEGHRKTLTGAIYLKRENSIEHHPTPSAVHRVEHRDDARDDVERKIPSRVSAVEKFVWK